MNVPVFYLRNHVDQELRKLDDVSQLATLPPRPDFPDKSKFLEWAADSRTNHCFYLLAEPRNPQLIPNSTANPVVWLHGLIADYDGLVNDTAIAGLKFAPGRAPTWISRTFSGGARIVWLFEQKIPIFGGEVWKRFSLAMAKELKAEKLLAGFDRGAWEKAGQHYELGTQWFSPFGGHTRLPHNVVMTALHDASNKARWKPGADVVPLDVVAEEVERRWPGRWQGPFVEGAQGVRFWDQQADNQTGAWIRAHGVQAFTGEGRFLYWDEILGEDFIKQFRANRIGGAVSGVYFDDKAYWQKDDAGHWRPYGGEAIKRRLCSKYGLSSETKKGASSEVANAVTVIEDTQHVDGVFPLLFIKEQIVVSDGMKYLNIARSTPTAAGAAPGSWGDGFPWLGEYLLGLFGQEQLEVFLSWLARFYVNAVAGKPRRGHALFISGPPSAGKTLLTQRVIGGLMGGFREATDFVLGATTFNEDLAHAAVWAIDDAVASSDPRRHAVYSQIVKKIIANPKIQFHPKFQKAVTHQFNGRLVVTLNDDPESLQMLPQVDQSVLDKLVILKAFPPTVKFGDAEENIARELPALAAYLLIHQTPDWLMTRADETARYGHDAWHHPELLLTAKQSSSSVGLYDLLEIWRRDYFRAQPAAETWEGNPTELLVEFNMTDAVKGLVDKTCPTLWHLSRDLQKLVNQQTPWVKYLRTSAKRKYLISKPCS